MIDNIPQLANSIWSAFNKNRSQRFIVALAGAPGSGKSTIAKSLLENLSQNKPELKPVVVPMDGFHLDNCILDKAGLRDRKGAAHTFDSYGYVNALSRIKNHRENVLVPEFDRNRDMARAGAIKVVRENKLIITEGNYLLLDEEPWCQIAALVDMTVFLEVGMRTLETRLRQRWLDHGYSESEARRKSESNDLINASYVVNHLLKPDIYFKNEVA